jgi:hypothetical protein
VAQQKVDSSGFLTDRLWPMVELLIQAKTARCTRLRVNYRGRLFLRNGSWQTGAVLTF